MNTVLFIQETKPRNSNLQDFCKEKIFQTLAIKNPSYAMKIKQIKTKLRLWYCYRLPNSSVDLVSASLKLAGEQQMMMVVRALPPRDSCRIRVSFESLYGMCVLFPSARAEMTFPRAESDLLMFLASSNTVPSAPVLLTCNKAKNSS
jgi:hypothetical protein